MRTVALLLSCCAVALAQPFALEVTQITNTGAALCYTATDTVTPYTIEVSAKADFSVLVHDVNSQLFTGAASDLSRPDTVAQGTARCVQIGHTGHFFDALDGSRRDRVLQAFTTYHWRVGGVVGPDFTTSNIPFSIVNTQPLDVKSPFVNSKPSTNPNYQSSWRDPWSGLLIGTLPDWSNSWGAYNGPNGVTLDVTEGAGWSASSGTLADSTDNNDNVYAQTSTAGSWLFLGLGDINGSKIPHSSSFFDILSFQNVLVRADCNGSGCGSGLDVEICLTFDGTSTSPECRGKIKTFHVTTTEAETRICHPENGASACSAAENPGDIWSPESIDVLDWRMGKGKIWNGAAGGCSSTPTLCFTVQADCDSLRVNDTIRWWYGSNATARIVARSCASNPPSVTLNDSYPADNNGSTGLPFLINYGLSNNQGYGFLLRKKDPVANATLRVDSARWVAGASVVTASIALGSGGFQQRCQKESLRTTNGWLLCAASNGIWAFKDVSGELQSKFLGSLYLSLGAAGAETKWHFAEQATWSETEVGTFYITASAVSGNSPLTGVRKKYLLKIILNTPEKACGEVGSSCTLPSVGADQMAQLDKTVVNMTPCLNLCTSASDDYTLDGQILRLDPAANFARFAGLGIRSVQGNYIVLGSREGSQDSFGEYYAFDLGNGGIPGSTYVGAHGSPASQQLFARNATYANPSLRWSGDHTHQSVLGTDAYTVIEAGNKATYDVTMDTTLSACTLESTCDVCPSITVDGYNFTGKKRCSAVDLSSSWNPSWEAQPPQFASGDPVNAGSCGDNCSSSYHWLQKLAVGDRLFTGACCSAGFEVIKLIRRDSNTHWIVERGCGQDQGLFMPRVHSGGTNWRTEGLSSDPICANDGLPYFPFGAVWDFKNDPTGSNMGWTYAVNHALSTPGVRMHGSYGIQINDFTNFANAKLNQPVSSPGQVGTFAGIFGANSTPNCVEQHPSYHNYAATDPNERVWFADADPLSCFGGGLTATRISESLYSLNSSLGFSPKQFPLGMFLGYLPTKRVDVIDGTLAHWGEWCYAVVANDCFGGSSASTVYVNGPIDTTQAGNQLEFWSGQMDISAGNTIAKAGSSAAQNRLPPNTATSLTNNHFRSLSKDVSYRASATANIKPMPDGKWFNYRDSVFGWGISNYAKLPPFPADDRLDRRTYLPRTITIPGGSIPAETLKARLKFGYDENFRCNDNTSYACYAVSSNVNESNPFLWEPEVGASGVSCATGCAIDIPSIEGRILRYQAVFVNALGTVTGTLPVSLNIGALSTPGADPDGIVRINGNVSVQGAAGIQ